MLAIFKQSLFKSRGTILGWGITLAALGLFFVPFYDTIAENAEQFQKLIDIYPKEIMAFFAEGGMANFTTPEGFLSIEYFSFMPLVVGFLAILGASGLLAADEEHGVLDLVAAHPVSRSAIFFGKLAGLVTTMAVVLGLGYAALMIATNFSVMDLDAVETLYPFASMFALLFFFAGFALFLSMVLPSRQTAAMVSGITLVASFFLHGLAGLNDSLAKIEAFLPNTYYQSQNWTDGFKVDWFLGLLGVGAAFMLLAWWRFLRRDIRVAGEGGWRLPKLSALFTRRAASKA